MFSLLKHNRYVPTDSAASTHRRGARQDPLFESGEEHFAQDIETVERADPNWDDRLRIDDAVLRLGRGMSFEQAVAVFGEDAAERAQLILRIRSGESFRLIDEPIAAFSEEFKKLAALHLQMAETSLREVAGDTRAELSVKDAQELLALQASILQPAAEKAAAYSRHLFDIAAATKAAVGFVAEVQIAEAQEMFAGSIEAAMKSAPPGSESAVAMVIKAMADANNAYESVSKAAKQVAEANLAAVTKAALKATRAADKTKRD